MEMSSDGSQLVFGHANDDRVSIYGVLEKEVLATLSIPSPRHILLRGDTIYASNPEDRQLTVFEKVDDIWEIARSIELPRDGLIHLSAAGGHLFRGELVLTFHTPGPSAETAVFWMSRSGQFRELATGSLGSLSFNGRILITQQLLGQGHSGTIQGYALEEFLERGQDARNLFCGADTPFVYQVSPHYRLAGRDRFYGGEPFGPLAGDWGDVVFVDRTRECAYGLRESRLVCSRLKPLGERLGERKVEFAEACPTTDHLFGAPIADPGNALFDHPEAATLDGRTFLFIRTTNQGVVLHAEAPAFGDARTRPVPTTRPPTIAVSAGVRADLKSEVPLVRTSDPSSIPRFAGKARTWTGSDGSKIVATLVSFTEGGVILYRHDKRREITVPLIVLSDADVKFLDHVKRVREEELSTETPDEPKAIIRAKQLVVGAPLLPVSAACPNLDDLDPKLRPIAEAIGSLEYDRIKPMKELVERLRDRGIDTNGLLPFFAWGLLQSKSTGLYTPGLFRTLDPCLDAPGAEAIAPDLIRFTRQRLEAEDRELGQLKYSFPALAKLGYYEFILPYLDHQDPALAAPALKSVVALMDENVTPSPEMIDVVWKLTERVDEGETVAWVCAILGRLRPVEDRAFDFFDKCIENKNPLAAVMGLTAAHSHSSRAREILTRWKQDESVDPSFIDHFLERATKRERRLLGLKPGGIAYPSGEVTRLSADPDSSF